VQATFPHELFLFPSSAATKRDSIERVSSVTRARLQAAVRKLAAYSSVIRDDTRLRRVCGNRDGGISHFFPLKPSGDSLRRTESAQASRKSKAHIRLCSFRLFATERSPSSVLRSAANVPQVTKGEKIGGARGGSPPPLLRSLSNQTCKILLLCLPSRSSLPARPLARSFGLYAPRLPYRSFPFFFLPALIEPPLDFDDTFGHPFDDPTATILSLSLSLSLSFSVFFSFLLLLRESTDELPGSLVESERDIRSTSFYLSSSIYLSIYLSSSKDERAMFATIIRQRSSAVLSRNVNLRRIGYNYNPLRDFVGLTLLIHAEYI